MPTRDALTISADLRPGERGAIVDGLVAFNTARGFPWPWHDCDLVLRDAAGAVRGGALGETNAGWLFLKALWVDEALRGRGHGQRLLAATEDAARSRGCLGVYLDTYSFQARPFYERAGYRVFGTLPDHPPGGAKYYLAKRLDASVAAPEPPSVASRTTPVRYAGGFAVEAFLALAGRVWPRAYDRVRTAAALARTTNVGAWTANPDGDGEQLIGAVRVLTDGYLFATVPEILVDPAYRRRGIGRELMDRALAHAPRGVLFFGAQPEAIAFFERLGCGGGLAGFTYGTPRPLGATPALPPAAEGEDTRGASPSA